MWTVCYADSSHAMSSLISSENNFQNFEVLSAATVTGALMVNMLEFPVCCTEKSMDSLQFHGWP